MKKMSGSSYSLILVILVTLFVMGASLKLESSAGKLLPLLISSIVLVLALIDLMRGGKSGRRVEEADATIVLPRLEKRDNPDLQKYLGVGAWIVGLALSIYLVGFTVATVLFVGAYMKWHGSKWPTAVITALVYAGIIYTVFELGFKADLYKGRLLMNFTF